MGKKLKIFISVLIGILVVSIILVFLFSFLTMDMQRETSSPRKSPVSGPKSPNSVDRLLDRMEFGAIAFNVPANININDTSQIQLLLSLSETVDKLKRLIVREGMKVGATIRVSNRMEARLSGYMFQITAITPEIQAVSKNRNTQWKWEIHPKKEGKHRLHLTLTALLEIDGHSTPRTIRAFDKEIEITVTRTQKFIGFITGNWQWLWAAIFVPIVGWFWKRKKADSKAT